jgi:hypothetical protein
MKFIFKFPRADAESIVTEGNTYGEAADKAIAERVRHVTPLKADGSGVGPIKIACMHDPYDLRCPVCGHSVFSHLSGAAYACEGCGVQLSLFPDKAGCRFLMEVQGA